MSATTQQYTLTPQSIKSRVQTEYARAGDSQPFKIYRDIMDDVEKPMLEEVLKRTKGNQSKAAINLGMNRATLRTKLKRHNLM